MNNPKLQKDFENATTAYKQVSLSVSEKEMLKEKIFTAIDTEISQPVSREAILSPFMSWSLYLRVVPAALLIVLLVGTPVAFAAEHSLPGDTLYSFKTKINEEVVGAFVSKTEKDEYYESLLTKRASEIRVLAKQGKLDDERLAIFEEILEDNVHDAIATSVASEESPKEILQDHQAIVALLTFNEEVLGVSNEKDEPEAVATVAATFATEDSVAIESPIAKIALLEEEPLPTKAVMSAPSDVQNKLTALKSVALAAIIERVEDVISDGDEKTQELVQELVNDAKEKVAAVLAEQASDADDTEEERMIEDQENEVLRVEVEEQATALSVSSSTSATTTLGELLELHERLSRKKIAKEVERLVEENDEREGVEKQDIVEQVQKEIQEDTEAASELGL